MVGASSGVLDHIGRLDLSRVRGAKDNIGEQREREFRLASYNENRSRCCHLVADVCRGNVRLLRRTGSQ